MGLVFYIPSFRGWNVKESRVHLKECRNTAGSFPSCDKQSIALCVCVHVRVCSHTSSNQIFILAAKLLTPVCLGGGSWFTGSLAPVRFASSVNQTILKTKNRKWCCTIKSKTLKQTSIEEVQAFQKCVCHKPLAGFPNNIFWKFQDVARLTIGSYFRDIKR